MLSHRLGEVEMHCGTLQAKNTSLAAEVQQLRGIINMMARDTSALATQVRDVRSHTMAQEASV